MSDTIPNPGSPEARARSCRCPIVDNHYGAGAYLNGDGQPQFWIAADCPLHATPDAPMPKDPETGDLWT
jgi:hypothetical protein